MKPLYEAALQVNAGSQVVDWAANVAVNGAVDGALNWAVDDAVRMTVNRAVPSGTAAHMIVSEVVHRAVNGFKK